MRARGGKDKMVVFSDCKARYARDMVEAYSRRCSADGAEMHSGRCVGPRAGRRDGTSRRHLGDISQAVLEVLHEALRRSRGDGSVARVLGDTGFDQRMAALAKFKQSAGCYVLLLAVGACASGLTLTEVTPPSPRRRLSCLPAPRHSVHDLIAPPGESLRASRPAVARGARATVDQPGVAHRPGQSM